MRTPCTTRSGAPGARTSPPGQQLPHAGRRPPVTVASAKASLAGLVAHRDPADPAITEARRQLKKANLTERIREAVATWPPLTEAQRADLAVQLLSPAGDHAGA